MFSFILSLSSYASDACRNLRNNRSEISRNIGREVYSKLLEIVSTFLSRGFRSLKLRFLLSKEIFFINQCFRARQRKKKKKNDQFVAFLLSVSLAFSAPQFRHYFSFPNFFFFFILSPPFPGFSRCFLNIDSLYIRAEKQTRVTKVEIRTIDTEKRERCSSIFSRFFFFFFFSMNGVG